MLFLKKWVGKHVSMLRVNKLFLISGMSTEQQLVIA